LTEAVVVCDDSITVGGTDAFGSTCQDDGGGEIFCAGGSGAVLLVGSVAPYDITPVASSIASELSENLPVVLGIVGAVIALCIAVRAVRKFKAV
jgi:hypothetical protein